MEMDLIEENCLQLVPSIYGTMGYDIILHSTRAVSQTANGIRQETKPWLLIKIKWQQQELHCRTYLYRPGSFDPMIRWNSSAGQQSDHPVLLKSSLEETRDCILKHYHDDVERVTHTRRISGDKVLHSC